ncbi:hypothetical protein SAMN04489761_0690 [Tenacibaculum sp. MAR_2009_124]|uniref:hypothetical protein n=1 Tax=Tenacibaculum sp. MAR_2009_124 TaxID=1250059 RepID=UPI00089B5537|nr:hypothetical protein [Tenacibaculum sp. MAR_2009_124]SEB43415.1 hypothetical protein SAMN04489761_0690 [Tenacibaculum sp. MAR_2009_124]
MKKLLKIVGLLLLILTIALGIYIYSKNEPIPEGRQGKEADELAQKMLNALNYKAYENTRFIEWSFRGKHFYKWDREMDTVSIVWNDNRISLDTKNSEKSIVYLKNEQTSAPEILQKGIDYFNNDSFWLLAPYKVFEHGVKRSIVNYENKDALLITYTTGGSTPGDSYLWILDEDGKPVSYKMWVSIIPIGGMEATWNEWITCKSGAVLPSKHQLSIGVLDLGNVKGYN